MSKILLNNYQPTPHVITGKPFKSKGDEISFVVGFSIDKDQKKARLDIISDIISTLLICDKLFIPLYQVPLLLKALKEDDVFTLLRNDALVIINDRNLNPTIIIEDKLTYKASCLFLSEPDDGGKDTLQDIEEKWQKQNLLHKDLLDQIIVLLSKKMVIIDAKNIGRMIENEIDYDLRNTNLTNRMSATSTSRENINPNDIYKILRLLHINKGLAYASILGLDTVLIDSEIRPILNDKIAPILLKNSSYDCVNIFQNILSTKGLPDLGYIYDEGIISINDILALRQNIDGIIFRKWYESIDYNQHEAFKILLNKIRKPLQSIAIKHVRWIYPKIIGLVNPIAGFATSYVESFVIDKFLKGWHPSFFLDNRLKAEIDNKIEHYEQHKFLEDIKIKFPNIGRNDICPCGSGKKFKKCCGM